MLAIGAQAREGDRYPDLTTFPVPAATWAVFEARGTLSQDEHPIGELMTRIMADWFASSGYERSMNYDLEIYGPGDTGSPDYVCEVWIPVKRA